MALEGTRAGQQLGIALGELAHWFAETLRQCLTVHPVQFWLGVEKIHLAGTAHHEHENHGFGAWSMVRHTRSQWIGCTGVSRHQA